jgi:hypothetical protein
MIRRPQSSLWVYTQQNIISLTIAMETSKPLTRPVLNASGNRVSEELRPFSPASMQSTSGISTTSRQSALEQCEPPNNCGDEVGGSLRWARQTSLLSITKVPATTRRHARASIDTTRMQPAVQPRKCSPPRLAQIGMVWKRCAQIANRTWNRSWTAETCSYTVSIMALAGLVTTLLAHQNKPLPQWPQLVTINLIISLFALIMRAGVGVVLAEGMVTCPRTNSGY